jgi:hypothetical protein
MFTVQPQSSDWTTRAHHQRFIDSPSVGDVLMPIGAAFGGPHTLSHVSFVPDVTNAFKQPVTEVLTFTTNSPESKQKALELFTEIVKHRDGFSACGPLEEKDDVIVYVAGWKSLEVNHIYLCLRSQLTG